MIWAIMVEAFSVLCCIFYGNAPSSCCLSLGVIVCNVLYDKCETPLLMWDTFKQNQHKSSDQAQTRNLKPVARHLWCEAETKTFLRSRWRHTSSTEHETNQQQNIGVITGNFCSGYFPKATYFSSIALMLLSHLPFCLSSDCFPRAICLPLRAACPAHSSLLDIKRCTKWPAFVT
jgi:hypothetical protein